jgi:hypothetical protein
MAQSVSQILRESLDRCLMMTDKELDDFKPRNQIERMACTITRGASDRFGPPDPSMLKYVIDRLLGRAAVSADVSIATPKDLDAAIDVSLKDYAAKKLAPLQPPVRKPK